MDSTQQYLFESKLFRSKESFLRNLLEISDNSRKILQDDNQVQNYVENILDQQDHIDDIKIAALCLVPVEKISIVTNMLLAKGYPSEFAEDILLNSVYMLILNSSKASNPFSLPFSDCQLNLTAIFLLAYL